MKLCIDKRYCTKRRRNLFQIDNKPRADNNGAGASAGGFDLYECKGCGIFSTFACY